MDKQILSVVVYRVFVVEGLLLMLTLASFLPQLHLIWMRKNASGIALSYILFNVVVATEQFCLNFGLLINGAPSKGSLAHDPIITLDWLNFSQTTLSLLLFIALLLLCFWFPSDTNIPRKRWMLGAYTLYLAIVLIPLFIDVISLINAPDVPDWQDKYPYRSILVAMIVGPHGLYLSYIATALAIAAICIQARVILQAQPSPGGPSPEPLFGSLSLASLGLQCVTFIVLAVAWVFRLSFGPGNSKPPFWFQWGGCIIVNNAIIGVGQGVLLLLALWRQRDLGGDASGGEREPLLGSVR
ncbi:hypothetical protein BJY00DRAFT_313736 [Aspergillus carlsbadensis]|nr:hypothetical protein BJY00DRAFT_313736 [Aspergillus carlsbadensis]